MKHLSKTIVITAAVFASQSSFASCAEPAAPSLPNPDTAVTPEMVKAKKQVKQYMAEVDKYLSCKRLSTRQHNAMVDKMHSLANNFNDVIRAFKERKQG
ncbi:MAG: hypothetical protein OIF35_12775 [Cellvibrionaceae bacterium]|nr:hypothetical protein [Cellvibrionaceae bacterium]MCV6624475.1 hypothetical protein [Cellvibrionaceae bacterium]